MECLYRTVDEAVNTFLTPVNEIVRENTLQFIRVVIVEFAHSSYLHANKIECFRAGSVVMTMKQEW